MKKLLPLILILFAAPCLAVSFFGDSLSPRERQKIENSLNQSEEVLDGLDALQLMMMFASFSEGDCGDFIKIEGAAKKGDAKNQWLLADLYHRGLCVKKNDKKALELLHNAAENGHEDAFVDLGNYYYSGIGTEKNYKQSFYWFSKAAEVKHSRSYRFLALMSLSGDGTTQNYQNAYKWGLLGAKAGDHYSQYLIASLMSSKDSEFYDPYEGYKWALLAKQSDDPDLQEGATKTINTFENALSTEKVQAAQDAVQNWKPEKPDSNILQPVKLPKLKDNYADSFSPKEALTKLEEHGIEKDRDLFFQAVIEDNLGVFKLFVKAGAPLDARAQGIYGTPLYVAAKHGSQKVFQFLLKSEVDINTPINHDNDTALIAALSSGHKNMAKALLKKDATASHPGLVFNAVQFDDPTFLDALITAGAPWDNEWIPGQSALSEAVSGTLGEDNITDQHCFPASTKYLLEKGANPNLISEYQGSMLMQAINTKNPDRCLRLLLEHGADVSYKSSGTIALFNTVLKGDPSVTRLLLEHGANPNETYALKSEQIPYVVEDETLKSALMNGATPLMITVSLGHAAATEELINHGADQNKKSANGVTALTLAEKEGNQVILDTLKQAPK